ncbi:acyltransferase family protein [Thiobacillus denitrificans]|uniref:acyltransferase family protein n=1 Tax=Thiobacillus denitrificans TaxID=36861 RepID=UPI000A410002|nr:acyltransferase family protein [Thiobacillus denitrificans]
MLDTTFLRFIAVLLITNSHLDKLYPVPAMSTGGQLGNSLFFMLSGFGLAASYRKKGDVFWPWLQRRLARIYPSVLLVALTAAVVTGAVFEWGVTDYVRHLLWPTEYWFVAAIVCFYVPFFWLMKLRNKAVFLQLIALLFLPYFYFYLTTLDLSHFSIEGGYFKWIFYFQIMLLGGFLANPFPGNVAVFWPAVIAGAILIAWVSFSGARYLTARSRPQSTVALGKGVK